MKKLFTLFAVAALAFAANAATLTVAEGATTNGHVPMYGLYCDTEGTISQMIYPAEMLTDMVGQQITEIKFYTSAPMSEDLEGCVMNFALKVVEENEFPTSEVFDLGGIVSGTVSPIPGETEFVLTLDEPFLYEGGNLLIGTEVIETSGWKGAYFYGIETGLYGACYQYTTSYASNLCYREAFLPMATFTYEDGDTPPTPPTPTEQCAKPEGGFENGIDFHGVTVTLINNETAEGTELHYNITLDGELIVEDAIYDEAFALTQDGEYYIDFWATAPDMLDSSHGGLIFTIDPTTGLSELLEGKTVAGVRYYNMAGQEMQEANGMTIVVTTYTDGTTSAVKVVK